MISRRNFLGVSSLAAVGAATGCQTATSQGEGSGQMEGGDLPPSIAALTSRADEAVPISVAEREARIEKARRLIGYEPQYDLERGFRRYLDWYEQFVGAGLAMEVPA